MRKIKIIISLVLVIAATITFVYAGSENESEPVETLTNDDPWKELEKLVKAYYRHEGVNYKGKMILTDENGEKEKVLEEQTFDYTILGDEYQYRIGNLEFVNSKDYFLAVDHGAKTIAATRASKAENNTPFNIDAFKKIIEQKNALVKVSESDGLKIITIDNIEDPIIQGYQVYYSPDDYGISKMLIGMVRAVPVDEENIEENSISEDGYHYYLTVQFDTVINMNLKYRLEAYKKFIDIDNNKINLNPGYRDYELISHIE